MPTSYTYETTAGHQLAMTLYGEAAFDQRPCIVYVHGFKGFKDWGFVPHLGNHLAAAGFNFLAFNFSHNGIGADMETFSAPEKFARNTLSLELAELQEVLHLVAHTDFFGAYLRHRLGLLGHSRGGGLALLGAAASRDVHAVCTWAAVSTFERFPKPVREAWLKRGYHEVTNARTGQVFRMEAAFLHDLETHAEGQLNILKAVRGLKKPLLILHGAEDETVPYFEAEQLNIFADPDWASMRLIPQAGHTFGASHPFAGSNPALDEALDRSVDFFTQYLRR